MKGKSFLRSSLVTTSTTVKACWIGNYVIGMGLPHARICAIHHAVDVVELDSAIDTANDWGTRTSVRHGARLSRGGGGGGGGGSAGRTVRPLAERSDAGSAPPAPARTSRKGANQRAHRGTAAGGADLRAERDFVRGFLVEDDRLVGVPKPARHDG